MANNLVGKLTNSMSRPIQRIANKYERILKSTSNQSHANQNQNEKTFNSIKYKNFKCLRMKFLQQIPLLFSRTTSWQNYFGEQFHTVLNLKKQLTYNGTILSPLRCPRETLTCVCRHVQTSSQH